MAKTDATHLDAVLALTCELIRAPSVTPADCGCQEVIAQRLRALDFTIEFINFGDVTNLWASRTGSAAGPHMVFAGHTDVVPPGPLSEWDSPPFEPQIRDGRLYGRGAADMKSSLAAMIVAMETVLPRNTAFDGTVSLLITSDEEGVAIDGTQAVVKELAQRGIVPDCCVVGEPSSTTTVGDVVRCGRRGSLNGSLTVKGSQGHVAYPNDADNPIHSVLRALQTLTTTEWDRGNDYYPPTSFQISNINSGTGATNVIPGHIDIQFNFRFNTEHTAASLMRQVHACLDSEGLTYSIDWHLSGEPFLTPRGGFTEAVSEAINEVMQLHPELSTSGGTSDGRFIAPWAGLANPRVDVVELGPTNATIHKINENIAVTELEPLTQIYAGILRRTLSL